MSGYGGVKARDDPIEQFLFCAGCPPGLDVGASRVKAIGVIDRCPYAFRALSPVACVAFGIFYEVNVDSLVFKDAKIAFGVFVLGVELEILLEPRKLDVGEALSIQVEKILAFIKEE
jgi:hypothetical protein